MVFFQAEDGIRDLVRSRGLGDVYKRQMYLAYKFSPVPDGGPAYEKITKAPPLSISGFNVTIPALTNWSVSLTELLCQAKELSGFCLLYTSDAADERSSVDLGGRRIIKKKKRTRCVA